MWVTTDMAQQNINLEYFKSYINPWAYDEVYDKPQCNNYRLIETVFEKLSFLDSC